MGKGQKYLQVFCTGYYENFTDADKAGAVHEVELAANANNDTIHEIIRVITDCLGQQVKYRIVLHSEISTVG
jgi:hypothetical protein